MRLPRTHLCIFVIVLTSFVWFRRHYSRTVMPTSTARHELDSDSNVRAKKRNLQDFARSHPLENSCRYPVLEPEDANIKQFISHGYRVQCKHIQEELVLWNDDTGFLRFNRTVAERVFQETINCYYQTFDGGVAPFNVHTSPITPWVPLETETKIKEDMVEVKCYEIISKRLAYHNAFAQVAPRKRAYARSSDTALSLDIFAIDSTSLNMFRRHAPLSWDYMTNVMDFFVFEGYMKVDDNSISNLVPLLAGLRYWSHGPQMTSDIPDGPLDTDATPFLWHGFKAKNCATLFSDDMMGQIDFGLLNYYFPRLPGFKTKPTEHFYRPWHLFQILHPSRNSSLHCLGNKPIFKTQLELTRQMIKRYSDSCHFSFNFITHLTHEDPSNLEAMDLSLLDVLKELFQGDYLKNTVLVIMGDHGNRIGSIKYSYIGRIEERMPLFTVYLPKWFRHAHPGIERNLRINRHRLTTHFDAHAMFKDILEGRFLGASDNVESGKLLRGISLFRPIPAKRNCEEANVPVQFCVCMSRNRSVANRGNDAGLRKSAIDILSNWVLEKHSEKINNSSRSLFPVVMKRMHAITTNQYVQHGVTNLSDSKSLEITVGWKWLDGDIEYLEAEFAVENLRLHAVARFQHNKVLKTMALNVEPYVYSRTRVRRGH